MSRIGSGRLGINLVGGHKSFDNPVMNFLGRLPGFQRSSMILERIALKEFPLRAKFCLDREIDMLPVMSRVCGRYQTLTCRSPWMPRCRFQIVRNWNARKQE